MIRWCVLVIMLSFANGAALAATAVPVLTFTSTLGMNTHLGVTGYTDLPTIETELAYVGVKRVRDQVASVTYLNLYKQLYQDTGIKLTESVCPSCADSYASILAFILANRVMFNYIEGPNEPDGGFPITWNGVTGASAASQFAKQLFNDLSPMCTPPLVAASVNNAPSFAAYGPQVGCQDANIHTYTQYSIVDTPFILLSAALPYTSPQCPGKPYIVTETGNWTTPCTNGQTQAIQAKYILDSVFDCFILGSKECDIYELNDQVNDPTCTTQEWHFGLFNYDATHKTSADTFHNMTTLLADTSSITPTALTYTLTNFPANGQQLLLQKSDGTFWLALWNDAKLWNNTTFVPITVSPVSVTLGLGISATTINVYDPYIGTSTVQTGSGSNIVVSVPDHVILVNVRP